MFLLIESESYFNIYPYFIIFRYSIKHAFTDFIFENDF